METIIEKVDEVTYSKVTPQPDKVENITLDALLSEKESLLAGIENNKSAIAFQTSKLSEVDAEIEKVKILGIKSSVEIKLEEQAVLEDVKVEPIQIIK